MRIRILLGLLVAAGLACAEPNKITPEDIARLDAGLDASGGSGDVARPADAGQGGGGAAGAGGAIGGGDALPAGSDSAAPAPDAEPSKAVCGNGTIESGEECDPPGSCPPTCASRGCTQFALQGSAASCTARCAESGLQASCVHDDGCCPSGCNATSDRDCSITCGNNVKEAGETCDPLASCPTVCPAVGCQLRKLINPGTCMAECTNDRQQTACVGGDGCCPSTCNSTNDADCEPRCGNNVVEAGETCDPVSQCTQRQNACRNDRDNIRTPSGSSASCTFTCGETRRLCGPSDGECPSGCAAGQDPDCAKAGGASCTGNGECRSNACVDGVCCTQSCSVCQECKGSGGTCRNIGANQEDNYPSAACGGESACDGSGRCLRQENQTCGTHTECLSGYCGADQSRRICLPCGGPAQQCCPQSNRSTCSSGLVCDKQSEDPFFQYHTYCGPCGPGQTPCCPNGQCVSSGGPSATCFPCNWR
jgi:hypothetical protein